MTGEKIPVTPEDIYEMYGPGFKGKIDPFMRNIRTNAVSSSKHHCKHCNSAPTKKCFIMFHLCFCLEMIQPEKGGPKVICGERFALFSPKGCFTHPYNSGCNQVFKNLKLGKDLTPPVEKVGKDTAQKKVTFEEPEEEFDAAAYLELKRIEAKKQRETWRSEAAVTKSSKTTQKPRNSVTRKSSIKT